MTPAASRHAHNAAPAAGTAPRILDVLVQNGQANDRWIADAARWIEEKEQPDLSLVYLPHLDYDLQRFGPADPRSDAARARVIPRQDLAFES